MAVLQFKFPAPSNRKRRVITSLMTNSARAINKRGGRGGVFSRPRIVLKAMKKTKRERGK